jgi:Macrocin-O-methyltransferase (TylF)
LVLDHRERSLRPDQLDATKRRFVLSDVEIPVATQLAIGPAVRSLDNFTDDEVRDSIFFVYFTCDSDALGALRRIRELGGRFVPHLHFLKTDYRFVDRRAHDAMRATWARAERVSHLVPIVHENICEALAMVADLDGDYVEIGVFLGGSALTALHWLDRAALAGGRPRHVHLLDTFDGFDYDEAAASADMIWADTHHLFGVEQTLAHLRATFAHVTTPYDLVVSNICRDELPAGVERIAVANVDVDMYEPSIAALRKVAPLVVPGGIIIAEDPASTPGLYGAYTALHEFLDSDAGSEFRPVFKHGQYFLIKRW